MHSSSINQQSGAAMIIALLVLLALSGIGLIAIQDASYDLRTNATERRPGGGVALNTRITKPGSAFAAPEPAALAILALGLTALGFNHTKTRT